MKKKIRHKHIWQRMGAETIEGSFYEYLRCQCKKERIKADGKLQKEKVQKVSRWLFSV